MTLLLEARPHLRTLCRRPRLPPLQLCGPETVAAPQLLLLHERETAAVNYSLSHQLMTRELQELLGRWFVMLFPRHSHEDSAEDLLLVLGPKYFRTGGSRMQSDDLADFILALFSPNIYC